MEQKWTQRWFVCFKALVNERLFEYSYGSAYICLHAPTTTWLPIRGGVAIVPHRLAAESCQTMNYCGPKGVRTLGGRIQYAAQLRKTRRGREEPCGGRPRPLAMSVLLLRASPTKDGVLYSVYKTALSNNKGTGLDSAGARWQLVAFFALRVRVPVHTGMPLLPQPVLYLYVALISTLAAISETATVSSNRPPASLFAHPNSPSLPRRGLYGWRWESLAAARRSIMHSSPCTTTGLCPSILRTRTKYTHLQVLVQTSGWHALLAPPPLHLGDD